MSKTTNQLFSILIWQEDSADKQIVWRGKLKRLPDGTESYFQNLEALPALFSTLLTDASVDDDVNPS